MRILLDTHILLWYCAADPRLPTRFRDVIRDPANEVFVSVASIWEAVIKYATGRLSLPAPPAMYLPRQRAIHGFSPLPVDEAAMQFLAALPTIHRDPFDRLIVAQAVQHGLTLATVDAAVIAYGVPMMQP